MNVSNKIEYYATDVQRQVIPLGARHRPGSRGDGISHSRVQGRPRSGENPPESGELNRLRKKRAALGKRSGVAQAQIGHSGVAAMILPQETAAAVSASPIDLDLIRKYSIPAPRYTSYPPATKFTTEIEKLGLESAIGADNERGAAALSLYFHLPFCHSACWY